MSFLDKLNYLNLDDQIINDNLYDNLIKEFVDTLFGGDNSLDMIKYKYPKTNQLLNELANYYKLLNLDSNLDELNLKLEISNYAHKLTNLDKKKDELNILESNLKEIDYAKQKIIYKKDQLTRLKKEEDLFENLKEDASNNHKEFEEFRNKTKAIQKILKEIDYQPSYSIESIEKLKNNVQNLKSKVNNLDEFVQLFDGINSENDLKMKINYLNEELKNYKDFFIKTDKE